MAQKYTIFKLIIQNLNKVRSSDRGFTLLELIVGMLIMIIVGGLAMNAFIQTSITFNQDKKTIDTSQNLSTILELIGNDIKQSGEQISDSNFPTIEFNIVSNTDTGSMAGSSKVTTRRALTEPLTLCQKINAATNPTTLTTLVVADNTAATVTISANCDVGSSTSGLLAARPSTTYKLKPTVEAVPSPALALILPSALRKVRDYRCELDDINPTVAYDASSRATEDFCGGSALEKVRIAVSDQNGHILTFNQTNEAADATNTATAKKYNITINTTGLDTNAIANNTKNKAVEYPIGSPIYLIEERVYSLDSQGNLNLSVNGSTPTPLVKRVAKFNISARGYTNTTDRLVNPSPAVVAADICATAPTVPTVENPKYICKFNYNDAVTDSAMNWKMIAGVKVELQSKYDGTGQSATESTQDTAKLKASAEYFPRNVLSK